MSDDGGYYQLQNILTNLAVRVGQLEGSLKTFMENWARQDQLAHDSRRIVHERLDLVGRQVERIATDLENVQQDIGEVKKELSEEVAPIIKTLELSGAKRLGAKGVWAIIGTAFVAVASAVAYLAEKISALLFSKPG